MDSFKPNSENAQTSLSVAPNDTCTGFVVPEVGFVTVAEHWAFLGEYARISAAEAMSIFCDDADHRNHLTEAANSGGRDITRMISRDRVSLMLSLEGKMVAM